MPLKQCISEDLNALFSHSMTWHGFPQSNLDGALLIEGEIGQEGETHIK